MQIDPNGEDNMSINQGICKDPQGSYTGISVQTTWDEQEKYLQEEKILKYPITFSIVLKMVNLLILVL